MTPRPQPGHPASTDLALGSSSAAAGETGRGALGMKAALARRGSEAPGRGAGPGEEGARGGACAVPTRGASAGRRGPSGPTGARGRGSVAARGTRPAWRGHVHYAALCMEPRWAPGHEQGPPRGACPRERKPLCPLAATLGFNVQRVAPSYADHRRRVRNKLRSGLQTLSAEKLRGAGARGLRPGKPPRAAGPARAPGRERRSLLIHGGASPPRAVHTRSGALCSRAPERSRALLWVLTAQRWPQGASRRAPPLRPEAPSGPRGWPGAVPASYLARRRTHVPFGSCLACSARPKAHPPPPSDP